MEWLYRELGEFAPLTIFLTGWVPSLLTVLVGGLFATIVFPRWQDRYVKSKILAERRLAISEEAAKLLNAYTTSWRRLIEISKHEKTLEETDLQIVEIQKSKRVFAGRRSDAHDDLMACLSSAKLFVNRKDEQEITKFILWAESTSILKLEDLPEVNEWRSWESLVLDVLRQR